MQQITHQNMRLTQLQNGGPILAQVKARLEGRAAASQRTITTTSSPNNEWEEEQIAARDRAIKADQRPNKRAEVSHSYPCRPAHDRRRFYRREFVGRNCREE